MSAPYALRNHFRQSERFALARSAHGMLALQDLLRSLAALAISARMMEGPYPDAHRTAPSPQIRSATTLALLLCGTLVVACNGFWPVAITTLTVFVTPGKGKRSDFSFRKEISWMKS
ncbi:hypothetical protein GOB93_19855 [Acetobacter musti]|uniref:Uncharacterized protein n=1 Tax=Acetobacter musti TaxID=864732 RepID=A0ABX0JV20_9PROT|nr:hypothetical protein [Acetobacter musti]NHN86835.1 hypothetical protein [Acetobacter musti]